MYHMHLELRWFFLTIMYARTMYSRSFNDLNDTLQLVIDDLVYISMKMFERVIHLKSFIYILREQNIVCNNN